MDLYFSENYDQSDYMLIEIPPSLLEQVQQNPELVNIKGGETSIFCTQDKTYELKFVETSNNFLLVENGGMEENKLEIAHICNYTVECVEYHAKKYSIVNLLKENSGLSYDILTCENNLKLFSSKLSQIQLFSYSELCLNDFNKMIEEYNIFEKDGIMCIFEEDFLYFILEWILMTIASNEDKINYKCLNSEDIFSDYLIQTKPELEELIKSNCLSINEQNAILKNIFDPIYLEGNIMRFSLNFEKTKLFCAKNIFRVRKEANFRLEEYIRTLKATFNIGFPFEFNNKETEENIKYTTKGICDDNLFDGFLSYDLRFLKGICTVIYLPSQRDHLIK
jgi:hypothetical protein